MVVRRWKRCRGCRIAGDDEFAVGDVAEACISLEMDNPSLENCGDGKKLAGFVAGGAAKDCLTR